MHHIRPIKSKIEVELIKQACNNYRKGLFAIA